MKLPISWLKDFLPIRLDPDLVAERLTGAGFEVEEILEIEGDKVLEVAVMPNRGDCLSIIGLAREVGILFKKPIRMPKPGRAPGQRHAPLGKIRQYLQVDLRAKRLCPRYAVRVIRDLRIAPSPPWLARRLEQCGVRSLNNIVDVTNYVSLEQGQPMHPFDLEKIGRRIIIRSAEAGESLTTLDQKDRSLNPEDLLIADETGGIALAGIMGGLRSEVGDSTRHIALESAFFDPATIRRTARRLGISSESSYRFERRVDPEGVVVALDRATELLVQLASGVPTSDWIDRRTQRFRPRSISFSPEAVQRTMGGRWPRPEVVSCLRRQGISRVRGGWRVPSWRDDLRVEADLVEEVARLTGLDRVPSTFPPIASPPASSAERRLTTELRRLLTDLGFTETVHLSFLSPRDLRYDPSLIAKGVAIANPLGEDQSILRPSLIPSLLKTASYHHQHKIFDLRLFELRKVFWREEGLTKEALSLAAVASGGFLNPRLEDSRRGCDFFEMKGVLDGLLDRFRLQVRFEPGEDPLFHPGQTARVEINRETVGLVGTIHPSVLDLFDLKRPVSAFFLSWEKMLAQIHKSWLFKSYSKVPQVQRDLAVVIEENVPAGRIRDFLEGQELVRDVLIFDLYQGDQISKGKKSLAFSLSLGGDGKTLTEEEINGVYSRIVDSVRREFHADIR